MVLMAKSKFFNAGQVFIRLCFVSVFCHVSCVLVNVTREEKDIFTNPVYIKTVSCWSAYNTDACKKRNAESRSGNDGCICKCVQDKSTFLESELSCVENGEMRNNPWTFLLLNEMENAETPVGVLKLTSNNTIKIKMKPDAFRPDFDNSKTCQPYRVEIREKNGSWTLVNNQILKMRLNSTRVTKKYHANIKIFSNLILQWKQSVPACPFAGKIMRILINCSTVHGFIIFKVAGTFEVEIPESSSESSYVSPTLSVIPLANSTMSSIAISSVTQVFSTASFSYQHYQSIKTSLSPSVTSITPSITIASSDSLQKQSSETGTTLPFSLNSPTMSSSLSAAVYPPSPESHSKDSSITKTIIGAVIGGVFALVIAVVIILYVLRKRKQNLSGKSNSGQVQFANKNYPLPTLSNPVCEDHPYQSPENVQGYKKPKSGVKSIDNADYDQCIVVENPSARDGVPSVYDNITDPQQSEQELPYHALDPAKREPSNKYQSLVKPEIENEYSTISDDAGSSSLREPVYSVVDEKNATSFNQPKPDPVYNILEANDSSLQPVAEPVYNVLEQSNEIQGKQEPVYYVIEKK